MTNPEVSPLYGSLTGLPRTTVYSGNLDILSPDVLVLQQDAAMAGAPFNFVLANGEIHDWIILTPTGRGTGRKLTRNSASKPRAK